MNSKVLPKLIKQLVTPVMAKYGFDLTSKMSGAWLYEKIYSDSYDRPRKVLIWFSNMSWYPAMAERYIRFRIDINPSYFYNQVDLNVIIHESKTAEKVTKKEWEKEWEYKTEEDVVRILHLILSNMENGGFDLLDKYCHDFADSVPTVEDDKALLNNHDLYLNTFCNQHKIDKNDTEALLKTIVNEIEEIPSKSARENCEQLKIMAAALGHIYIINGCSWEWDNTINSTQVAIYRKNEHIPAQFRPVPYCSEYPLHLLWGVIQRASDEKMYLKSWVENDISYIQQFSKIEE